MLMYGTSCFGPKFICLSGLCIDLARQCDGVNDCPADDSDETNCSLVVASSNITLVQAGFPPLKSEGLKVFRPDFPPAVFRTAVSIPVAPLLATAATGNSSLQMTSRASVWAEHNSSLSRSNVSTFQDGEQTTAAELEPCTGPRGLDVCKMSFIFLPNMLTFKSSFVFVFSYFCCILPFCFCFSRSSFYFTYFLFLSPPPFGAFFCLLCIGHGVELGYFPIHRPLQDPDLSVMTESVYLSVTNVTVTETVPTGLMRPTVR
jgi:hypothetical protein